MERTIKYVQSRDNDNIGHTRYGITNIRENRKEMERTIKYVQSRDNDNIGQTRYGITNIRENRKDNQVCTI